MLDEVDFSPETYHLPVPKIDGRMATELDICFSVSGSHDRTSDDDVALLEAMRIRAPVRLIVTGMINGKTFRLGGTDDDNSSYSCTVRVASDPRAIVARDAA